MAGIALIARELGYEVSGCDEGVYPPMSDVLQAAGIEVIQGYDIQQLDPAIDHVLIGNAYSRGNVLVEHVLNKGIAYQSGAQWLFDHVLKDRHVLAVSGTHGKTTTSTMLVAILQQAELNPGYLIGGALCDGSPSALLGDTPYFVIEADEYDTAFFDKRSKFVHYHPRTLVMNNLEYDHADIFDDLAAIQKQFHHLVRTVPAEGCIVVPEAVDAIDEVLEQGVWSSVVRLGDKAQAFYAQQAASDGSAFDLCIHGESVGRIAWSQFGIHNIQNALAAAAAAHHIAIDDTDIVNALTQFQGVKRRLEVIGQPNNITLYDDFAHHPTAIASSLSSLRARVGNKRIVAMIECGSNTMKLGLHQDQLVDALKEADEVVVLNSAQLQWDLSRLSQYASNRWHVVDRVDMIVDRWATELAPGDHCLMMSNKSFHGLHRLLLQELSEVTV